MSDTKPQKKGNMVETDKSSSQPSASDRSAQPKFSGTKKAETPEEVYRDTKYQRLKQTEERFIKWFKFIFVFVFVFGTFFFKKQISKWARGFVKDMKKPRAKTSEEGYLIGPDGMRLITKDELAIYHSKNPNERWVGLRGEVLNTTGLGDKFYTEGAGYEFFAGVDATRAFMTGDFDERGLRDDVWDFDGTQCAEVETWVDDLTAKYHHIGHVVGGYWYDEDGQKTEGHRQFLTSVKNEKRRQKEAAEERKKEYQKFAPCNVKADAKGTMTYSCTSKSGGVIRDWVGKPRKFKQVGKTVARCACVKESELESPQVALYPDCDEDSIQCVVESKHRAKSNIPTQPLKKPGLAQNVEL